MEIVVQGTGVEYFNPDEVILDVNFFRKANTYEEVLNEGVLSVEKFVNELLLPNGFTKEEMKTRSFVVREEKKYNDFKKNYEFDGFSYSQKAVIKFDFDKMRLAKIMEGLSKLENAPLCNVNFGVKNAKECKRKILATAYNDAYEQASAIAAAAGKTLKGCAKVDFKPFGAGFVSNARFGSDMMMAERSVKGAAQTIANTFTPEDIELSETLYCLWIAE